MDYLTSFCGMIHILSNSITLCQNWLVYRIVYTPIDTLEYIISKYYGIRTEEIYDILIN